MPKISIITPICCDTSQKVDWLDEMIQSIVSQTMTDWELILIDDKSPLSLHPIKTNLKYSLDKRLRWFENAQNDGPAKTRNTAVALAESECILPLDADDMLANNDVLEYMYDAWIMDNTKTVYGNVQLFAPASTGFQRGKVIQLAPYSFENAMNLGGTMPVTVMHSKECHYQAGGWKPELDQGREDVEYWIATGERGFCGLKVNTTTLLYRKHEQSRDYQLKFETQNLRAMQDKIKAMHSDVYAGRYPVACCGKGDSQVSVSDPIVTSQSVSEQHIKVVTPLEGYDENQLEWVAYRGPKKARSGSILTRGPANTPNEYPILGKGHVFQIHKSHRKLFSDRQKLGFEMNQPDPRQQSEPDPIVTPQITPQIIEMPKPEMSTIVRMDSIASQTKEADVQLIQNPAIIIDENDPRTTEQDFIDRTIIDYSLSDLGLSQTLTETLQHSNYTVNSLAKAVPGMLSQLPGIGIKRADLIIAKAQELISR